VYSKKVILHLKKEADSRGVEGEITRELNTRKKGKNSVNSKEPHSRDPGLLKECRGKGAQEGRYYPHRASIKYSLKRKEGKKCP